MSIQPRACASERRPQRGRAGLLVLLVLLALGGGAALLITSGFLEKGDPAAARPAVAQDDTESAAASAAGQDALTGISSEGRIEVGAPMPYKDLPRSFEGLGRISGSLEMVGGLEFPPHWTLRIEPSKFGSGREHATSRVIEFDGNETTFDETDLPLGGYTVSAEAEGLNSRPQEVLLFALPGTPTGGKTHVHLLLQLTPAGFVDGSVRDAAGRPVADLPVILEDASDQSLRETQSTAAGSWRFEGLRDGRYRIFYGSHERPLIPPRTFTFNAPQRLLEEDEIPVTASVAFFVIDKDGLAVMGAKVRGFGRPGGRVQSISGPDGVAIARFLPAGRYHVQADLAEENLAGMADFELRGDEELEPVQVVLYPRER